MAPASLSPSDPTSTGERLVSTRRLTKFYLLALGVVALLVIAGQVLVQHSIEGQAGDGRVINLAGRQRMLSQRLSKAALVVVSPMDEALREQALAELCETTAKWAQSHKVLRDGDEETDSWPHNTPAIQALYASMQPHHDAMVRAARQLAGRLAKPGATPTAADWVVVETILREEPEFLGRMDEIVGHYEAENRHGFVILRRVEVALAAVILLTLVIEALFIFRPALNQALRACEDRFRELFENAVEGIYESTIDGRWLHVNPALARMFGYESPATMMGRMASIDTDIYVQPGRRAEFLSFFKERDHLLGFESEVKCRDGSTRWVSENVRVVHGGGSGGGRLQGFVVDITQRRLSEEEWLRASKLESVGVLAGGIAHDFNNLLTAIHGFVTLARLDGGKDLNRDVSDRLLDAERGIKRAGDLTQQLLTFAKGGEPVRAAIRLGDIIREVTEFSLHGAKTRCEFDLPTDLSPVSADRGQITRVVQNLVINAVQAMPEGGVIVLRARNDRVGAPPRLALKAGDYVKISIVDQGMGIERNHLSKIFDPYFTTKRHGSGLGLAAVYSIVKKHEGLIEVESGVGIGTTFHIWLPAARQMQPQLSAAAIAGIRLRGRVLFMDDEASIRTTAAGMLGHLGLEVDLVACGTEAVRQFQEGRRVGRPYDVVVMDLTVPGGMGGLEALQKLRAIDPAVCAVVSSGYSSDPVMADYQAHGFRGCIAKPYNVAEFRQILHEVMSPEMPSSGVGMRPDRSEEKIPHREAVHSTGPGNSSRSS